MNQKTKYLLTFIISVAVTFTACVVTCILLTGCKSIEYVEVPKVSHDTLTIYKTKVDSVRLYDSISIKAVNDTVYIEKIKYRERKGFVHDSVYICKVDTITNVEVKEIEKKLTRWQGFKMRFGGWSFGFLLALIVGCAVYIFMKLKL